MPRPLSSRSRHQALKIETLESRQMLAVAAAAAADQAAVQMRLEVADMEGNPITQVAVGEQFQVRLFVEDLRANPPLRGVFAAFADVIYRDDIMQLVAGADGKRIQHGERYRMIVNGDATQPGLVNEVGGATDDWFGQEPGERLVASFRFKATAAGSAAFGLDAADDQVQNAILVLGEDDAVADVRFVGDQLTITRQGRQIVDDGGWTPPIDHTVPSRAEAVRSCSGVAQPEDPHGNASPWESLPALQIDAMVPASSGQGVSDPTSGGATTNGSAGNIDFGLADFMYAAERPVDLSVHTNVELTFHRSQNNFVPLWQDAVSSAVRGSHHTPANVAGHHDSVKPQAVRDQRLMANAADRRFVEAMPGVSSKNLSTVTAAPYQQATAQVSPIRSEKGAGRKESGQMDRLRSSNMYGDELL